MTAICQKSALSTELEEIEIEMQSPERAERQRGGDQFVQPRERENIFLYLLVIAVTFGISLPFGVLWGDRRCNTPAIKVENCSVWCDGIEKGNHQNKPIGFATQGAPVTIYPEFTYKTGVDVYCDCSPDSNNVWTVFQRRREGNVNFYRNWQSYVDGFGKFDEDYWLGLETLNQFTRRGKCSLRVDILDWNSTAHYAEYSAFSVGDPSSLYTLSVHNYTGNAGDALNSSSGVQFCSIGSPSECTEAEEHNGAWWFGTPYTSHLNGIYRSEDVRVLPGIYWSTLSEESLKAVEMKFRCE
ncbi:fibrinogen C domain-containing protein 1-B-like isoform X1 [Styela clava]